MNKVYLVGSLRNPRVQEVAAKLRDAGLFVFDDWHAAGPEADDFWQKYEQERGRTFKQALAGFAAQHVFNFDKHHLDNSNAVVLILPAGKSGHLELGYSVGRGVPSYILLDGEPERFDVMYAFATEVFTDIDDLVGTLVRELT